LADNVPFGIMAALRKSVIITIKIKQPS